MTTSQAIPLQHLHNLKLAARCSVGFVWTYEGLVPKILHPSTNQIDMIRNSGWWWRSPELTMQWLGIAMIIAGLIIMNGWREKLAQAVATISVVVLMALVIHNYPAALYDPFGGLAKDACLFTCSAVVWVLSGKTGR